MKDWIPVALLGALVWAVFRLSNRATGATYTFGDLTAAPVIIAAMDSEITNGDPDAVVKEIWGIKTGAAAGYKGTNVGGSSAYRLL